MTGRYPEDEDQARPIRRQPPRRPLPRRAPVEPGYEARQQPIDDALNGGQPPSREGGRRRLPDHQQPDAADHLRGEPPMTPPPRRSVPPRGRPVPPPGVDPRSLPPGGVPPVGDRRPLPPGFDPRAVPPGVDPRSLPPGGVPPVRDARGFPPGDPRSLPAGGVAPIRDPRGYPPGAGPHDVDPRGADPRGIDPRDLPPSGGPRRVDPRGLPLGVDPQADPRGAHGIDPRYLPPGDPRAADPRSLPPGGVRPPQEPSMFEDPEVDRLPREYYEDEQYDDRYDEPYAEGEQYDDGYDSDDGYDEGQYDEGQYDERYEDEDHPVGALLGEERQPERRRPVKRGKPRKKRRSAGRRLAGWVLAIAVVGGLAAGAWFGAQKLLGFGYEDFEGSGKGDVVVQVVDGDSTAAIAERLAEAGVVASGDAFVDAAESNDSIRSIRPGYYQVKKQMSGASAVEAIVADGARVGELQIRAGTQLDDLKDLKGKKIPGIYSLMSQATCAKVDGKSTCVTTKTLRATAEKADLTKLGAPKWLVDGASKAPKERQLEGMVMPGVYDIKPGWDAEQVLKEVLTSSAAQFEAAGLPDAAKSTKRSAYETIVIASIIEREAVENDFAKVSRVIYNRLAEDMRLEMDSTINYVLDRPHIRTTEEDRNKPGPYNSYRNKTLPPSAISAPSAEALAAALKPAEGSWLYFVKCEKNGLSCFAKDFDEHQANVVQARERGAW